MAMRLLSTPTALSHPTKLFFISSPKPISRTSSFFESRPPCRVFTRKMVVTACVKVEEANVKETGKQEWGKVSAVLFDMDGVLCNSENPSRKAAVDVFAEMGVQCTAEDFAPFTGMGFPGALELITQCKNKGLKVAVASSADRVKVDANLAAAGLPILMFDAVVSTDAFENLKPAPDIFLAASKILDVSPEECIVIEDAVAGVQAANAANMRCIAVTTTLREEALKAVGPSFIRNDIGNVSLDDILGGDLGGYSLSIDKVHPCALTRKVLTFKRSGIEYASTHSFPDFLNQGSLKQKMVMPFLVTFQEEDLESKPAEIKHAYDVKPQASTKLPPKMLI
ncbi:hypothetical protein F3Y22_tig00111402pilonHSYRG01109 [Hibiscus syriacus]|uniref:Uncharacterized protein n=1 Tax=Hibiscus syriacus TaxID=106335 RepID=A0A6A2YKS1_HIBSY|nr:hypothetical protein F3Y22_tig00111402pilonHSYRG01109 [Hibiscus syriacus]